MRAIRALLLAFSGLLILYPGLSWAVPENGSIEEAVEPYMSPETAVYVATGRLIGEGEMVCGINDPGDEIDLLKENKIDFRVKYFFEKIRRDHIELSLRKYSEANSLKNWAFDARGEAAEVVARDWVYAGRIEIPLKGFFEKYGVLRLEKTHIRLKVIDDQRIRVEIIK